MNFRHSIGLVLLLYACALVRHPRAILVRLTNPCRIEAASAFREHGPWGFMYPACLDGYGLFAADEGTDRATRTRTQQELVLLAAHMRANAPANHDMVDAADFGSNVRVIYQRHSDTVMINPEVVAAPISDTYTRCQDFYHGVEVVKSRPSWVAVEYTGLDWQRHLQRFDGGEACLIQTMLEVYS